MQDVVFRGLSAPLRLDGADAILPALREIARGWEFDVGAADPKRTPFYSISARPGQALFWCECHLDDRPRRWFDPVNAICDAVSALALALPAERPDVLCLHAAAVAMAGRLVVFPNIRRAGKSTLSAALAHAGFAVFSDDVLPVFYPEDGRARGLAMGTAPRLRLPLPESISANFQAWVAEKAGPANPQYQYLSLPDLPRHGETLPVGAFVILDREEGATAPTLTRVTADVAMDALLHQNFTRDRHSADILRGIAATLEDRPAYRLTYSDLDGAVACLTRQFAAWPDETPGPHRGPGRAFRMAEVEELPVPPALEAPVRQRAGCLDVTIGDKLYLADAEGRAIHRTDPLSAAIWALLAEPITANEILELLVEEFPEAERERIEADLHQLLARLGENGLISN